MSTSNSAHGRKEYASKKDAPKPQLKKHSHPSNSYVKKPRVTKTFSVARRAPLQCKLSHEQFFQLLPIPKGPQRHEFECAVSAFRRDSIETFASAHQTSFHNKAPLSEYFTNLRQFDNVLISKTPVWVIAQALNVISMGIEEFDREQIGTAGDHAYIIECVLNEHLKKDQPILYVNKHQPKLEFVKAQSLDTSQPGDIKSISTVITYLPASNCFYSIFAPMPVGSTGYVPLPAEWLRLTRFGSRPGVSNRKAGQPAKGAFIQEITKVYRLFVIDKKKRITTHGHHVGEFSIPLPPDWPIDPEVQNAWPTTKADRHLAFYKMLITSSKNV